MDENPESSFWIGLIALLVALVAGVGGYFIYTEVIQEESNASEEAEEDTEEQIDENSEEEATQSVLELIGSIDTITTFNELVLSTSFDETISSEKEFTIFVPTNEVFIAATISADPVEQVNFLMRHVVEGTHTPEDLMALENVEEGLTLKTLNGSELVIQSAEDGFIINGVVHTVSADFKAVNGVVYLIDGIL